MGMLKLLDKEFNVIYDYNVTEIIFIDTNRAEYKCNICITLLLENEVTWSVYPHDSFTVEFISNWSIVFHEKMPPILVKDCLLLKEWHIV